MKPFNFKESCSVFQRHELKHNTPTGTITISCQRTMRVARGGKKLLRGKACIAQDPKRERAAVGFICMAALSPISVFCVPITKRGNKVWKLLSGLGFCAEVLVSFVLFLVIVLLIFIVIFIIVVFIAIIIILIFCISCNTTTESLLNNSKKANNIIYITIYILLYIYIYKCQWCPLLPAQLGPNRYACCQPCLKELRGNLARTALWTAFSCCSRGLCGCFVLHDRSDT